MNTTTLNMTTLDGGVIIKRVEGGGSTPTPPSGGEVTYYSIPNDADIVMKRLVIGYATYIKGTLSTGTKIIEMAGPFVMRSANVHDYAEAVAIEWDAFYTNVSGTSVTCREHLAQLVGISVEEFSQLVTPITKEEFYSLD